MRSHTPELSSISESKALYSGLIAAILMLLALLLPWHSYSNELILVSIGLGVSIAGDFLLIRYNKIKSRFITYCLSTLLYISSLTISLESFTHWWIPILILAIGIVILLLILPQVEKRVLPILLLGILLLSFIWLSLESWIQLSSFSSICFLIASLLLFISAFFVAFRKERAVYFSKHKGILIMYTMAQCLVGIAVLT